MRLRGLVLLSLSGAAALLLSGCGATMTNSGTSAAPALRGNVFGGQQPVTGATVTVWEVTTGAPIQLASTTTDANGDFSIAAGTYSCTAGEQVYLTSENGNANPNYSNSYIVLAAGLGDCSAAETAVVNINEVTTVAMAYALNGFYAHGGTPTDSFAAPADHLGASPTNPSFVNAMDATLPMLVDNSTGTVQANTATRTVESGKINSMADVLAACVNDGSSFSNCQTLMTDAGANCSSTPADMTPANTLEAAICLVQSPWEVSAYNDLATANAPFVGLSTAPNDWTLGVSYTTTALGLGIEQNTSASMDIDTNGNVWFPSNQAGAAGAAYFDPVALQFNGPYNGGASMTYPQYLAIDPSNNVWVTDLGSDNVLIYPESGTAFSYTEVGATSGPIAIDGDGTAYFAMRSGGPSYIVSASTSNSPSQFGYGDLTYPPSGLTIATNGGSSAAGVIASTSPETSSGPCDAELFAFNEGTNNGDAVEATTGGSCVSGGAATVYAGSDELTVASSLDEICSYIDADCYTNTDAAGSPLAPWSTPEGLTTDGFGLVWMANSGNASVSNFFAEFGSFFPQSPAAYLHGTNNGGTMTTPYAVAVDGAGNVWVANASCVSASSTPCSPSGFTLSELVGAGTPTITPLAAAADGSQGTEPAVARRGGAMLLRARMTR